MTPTRNGEVENYGARGGSAAREANCQGGSGLSESDPMMGWSGSGWRTIGAELGMGSPASAGVWIIFCAFGRRYPPVSSVAHAPAQEWSAGWLGDSDLQHSSASMTPAPSKRQWAVEGIHRATKIRLSAVRNRATSI